MGGNIVTNTEIGTFTAATSIVKLLSVFIPANSFAANDIVNIQYRGEKTGTTNTSQFQIYWNTSDTLTSATQLTTRGIVAGNQYTAGYRRASIRTSNNNTLISGVGYSQDTDFSVWTAAVSTLSINWTVDSYLLLGGFSSATNPVRGISLNISN